MPDAPETPDYGLAAERTLLTASVVCLVGAVLAYASGDVVSTRSGEFRTQLDAVWVLATVAVALLAGAFIVNVTRNPRD